MVSLQYFRQLSLIFIFFKDEFTQGFKGNETVTLVGRYAAWID
jgi:hypothetical protein